MPLAQASRALREVEAALELGRAADIGDDLRVQVASYNREDCLSTWHLRYWLEGMRAEAVTRGCPARHGVPLQPQPPERRNVPRPLRLRPRR
jgi:uncharacterized protein